MRKREAKVGMYTAHSTSGRLLGQVTELRDSIVIFDGITGRGIAGYTEIEPFKEEAAS